MNENNLQSSASRLPQEPSGRPDGGKMTEEQFSNWLETALDELVAAHVDFATTNSNREYFCR